MNAKTLRKEVVIDGQPAIIKCELCFKTYFSITGAIYEKYYVRGEVEHSNDKTFYLSSCGCLHEQIATYFPEVAPFIKWHLCSWTSPLYYIENTLYHIKNGDFNYARKSAVWLDATDEELADENIKQVLIMRLPGLMSEFENAMNLLGFYKG